MQMGGVLQYKRERTAVQMRGVLASYREPNKARHRSTKTKKTGLPRERLEPLDLVLQIQGMRLFGLQLEASLQLTVLAFLLTVLALCFHL